MRTLPFIAAFLSLFVLSSGIQAQDATVDPTVQELRELAAAPSAAASDRAAVVEFLERPDVDAVATRYGIDLERLQDRVHTLDSEAAADLAERTDRAETQLDQVGGDVVVISSTAVIIGLLILLIIVAD